MDSAWRSGARRRPAEQQILRDSLQYHLDYFAGKEDDVEAS